MNSRLSNEQLRSLVEGVASGDNEHMLHLYKIVRGYGGRLILNQLKGEEMMDHVHDIYLLLIRIIRSGNLSSPESLMGMVHTLTSRQVYHRIEEKIKDRGRNRGEWRHEVDIRQDRTKCDHVTPESLAIMSEHSTLCETTLRGLSPKDQEVLIRYYIHEQKGEQVKAAMGLNETQYRLLKSRALGKFGKAGRKFLGKRKLKGLAAAA